MECSCFYYFSRSSLGERGTDYQKRIFVGG
jgi:hypothetical protein